jgi:hypothetical protein
MYYDLSIKKINSVFLAAVTAGAGVCSRAGTSKSPEPDIARWSELQANF